MCAIPSLAGILCAGFLASPPDPVEIKIDRQPHADGSCCLRMWGSGLINQHDGPQSPSINYHGWSVM